MQSLMQAYNSYENKVARGEFTTPRRKSSPRVFPLGTVIEASLGDIMIAWGRRLKRHALTGKTMNWSPLTGSKP